MNLTPEILLAAMEKGLPDEDWSRLIAALRELPKDAIFSLVTQGNITATGDGIVFGNNNRVFVIKGEMHAEAASVLREAIEQRQFKPPHGPPKVSISRLPVTGRDLFGRESELMLLDRAWANPSTNHVTFVAWGGVGKSALVNYWLRQMAKDNFRGADQVYAWSFYSQGTNDRATSADLFINAALRWFGDPDPTQGSSWDKGERLAQLIRLSRTLLLLDGLEPLQFPPNPAGLQEGRLKDPALQACLRELAAHQTGLCVITTREWVDDLSDYEGSTVIRHDLDHLTPQAGAQILRAQKIKGEEKELEEASREFDGHAFSLTLLGSYLDEVFDGNIRRRNEIEKLQDDSRQGNKACKMMEAYEGWLGDGPELAVLRMLGLFDRPVEQELIDVLRASPSIPALTDSLQNLTQREWRQVLARLRRLKLLANNPTQVPDLIDAHPLVREHFGSQLRQQFPEAWREASNRLYEHLTRTAKELPETIDEMAPLFAAVRHGCEAGRHQEVLSDVFYRRIQRGKAFFSTKELGLISTELAARSYFFDTPWHLPISSLSEADKGFILYSASYCLRALGYLKEAIQPMQLAMEIAIGRSELDKAAADAGFLGELYLVFGDLSWALALAKQSVELADQSKDRFQRMSTRTILADILHRVGQLSEAEAVFHMAEEIQRKSRSKYPILHAKYGFRYCDLLLALGQVQQVQERVAQTLSIAKKNNWILEIALDNLSLGRAWLQQACNDIGGATPQAADVLKLAVHGLRQAGHMDHLPRGLLARAELYRLTGDSIRAQSDLDEARRIAERGEMGLYLCDYHLESARFVLAQGDGEKACEHWAAAKAMVQRMGYHRREKDIAEIGQQLTVSPSK